MKEKDPNPTKPLLPQLSLPNSNYHLPRGRHLYLLLSILAFLVSASLILLTTTTTPPDPPPTTTSPPPKQQQHDHNKHQVPTPILDTLIHYALLHSNHTTHHMSNADLKTLIATIRRRCPCNLLSFGLSLDFSPLLISLNLDGRTVFLHENEYHISYFQTKHPTLPLEAYDLPFATTKVRDIHPLIEHSRRLRRTDCRAMQNLLYSECKLAINDMPNELYDVSWDVILVDGPRGYGPEDPGRIGSIFTAGVLARTNGGEKKKRRRRRRMVDVFVHEFGREVEKVSSDEFLCVENMVESNGKLAHFVIESNGGDGDGEEEVFEFCKGRNGSVWD